MALTKIKTGSVSDSITLTTPDINGGTIDATVIGAATPAAISGTTGQFGTSLNVDGAATMDGLTVTSSSSNAGTFKAVGGYAVQAYQDATSADHTALELRSDHVAGSSNRYLIRGYNTAAGTPVESFKVDTAGGAYFGGAVGIGTDSPNSYYSKKLVVSAPDENGITIAGTTSSINYLMFADGTSGDATYRGYLGYDHADDSMVFATAASNRMRIDSSGNVLVGKSSSNLGVDGVELKNGTSYFTNTSASPLAINREGTDGQLIGFYNDLVGAGAIICSGSSVSYATSSDYRLKEDDVPMTGATERVKALRPINFAWKADGSRVDGFFAHEAQEVVPEAVHGSKDAMRDEEYEVEAAVEEVRDEDDNVTTEASEAVMGTRSVPDMQGIDQSKLVPLLVAALQEAIARIEILEGA